MAEGSTSAIIPATYGLNTGCDLAATSGGPEGVRRQRDTADGRGCQYVARPEAGQAGNSRQAGRCQLRCPGERRYQRVAEAVCGNARLRDQSLRCQRSAERGSERVTEAVCSNAVGLAESIGEGVCTGKRRREGIRSAKGGQPATLAESVRHRARS